jgi:muramidase (phage lysozyme)
MKKHRRRLITVLTLTLTLTGILTACSPTQVQEWFSVRGINLTTEQATDVVTWLDSLPRAEAQKAITNPTLICIRRHESDRGGAPYHLGGAKAKNPSSSASGHYQWIDGSWAGAARSVGLPQYADPPARQWPSEVQHAVTMRYLRQYGKSPWRGSGC